MRRHIVGLLAGASLAAGAWACGGGTNLTTSPTGCAVRLSPSSQSAPAAGGTFALSVTVAQGCEWTAIASESWITMTRAAGSGSGSASYTIAPNASGEGRGSRIRVGDELLSIVQSPADCTYTVDPVAAGVPASGGTVDIRIGTSDGCTWSASARDSWIALSAASGSGPRTLTATAAANTTGAQRAGAIEIGSHTVVISQDPSAQSAACSVTLTGRTFSVAAGGGSVEVGVTIGPGCSWRTQGLPDWIQASMESASASARPVFTVAANTSRSARSATIRIADQSVTITQAGVGCSYAVTPAVQTVPDAGGTAQFTITAGTGCEWTAGSSDGWLRASPAGGSGNGTVTVTAAANPAASRRAGSVQIADQAVRVEQNAAPCRYSLASTSANVGADGGALQFDVLAASGCGWKADASESWIRITSGSGSGNASVRLTIDPTSSTDERRGSVRVEGLTFTVAQARCTYQVSWRSATTGEGSSIEKPMRAAASGDTLEVSVDTGSACSWQNSRAPEWITGVGAAEHRGRGGLKIPVACNTTKLERQGTMTIAGHTATLVQPFDPTGRCVR